MERYNISYPSRTVRNIHITGISFAACKTGFQVVFDGVRITLDAGLAFRSNTSLLLLTHMHGDHSSQLPIIVTKNIGRGLNVLCPVSERDAIFNHLAGMFALVRYPHPNVMGTFNLVGVDLATREYTYSMGDKKIFIVPIECFHAVPCLGYGISILRTKLKSEYHGLPPARLQLLRQQCVDITCSVMVPQLCFLGDTDYHVLANPILENYPVIMIECTYLGISELDNARTNQHMHWVWLMPYIECHPEITFILIHFSKRYTHQFITEFFAQYLLPNIVVWI